MWFRGSRAGFLSQQVADLNLNFYTKMETENEQQEDEHGRRHSRKGRSAPDTATTFPRNRNTSSDRVVERRLEI